MKKFINACVRPFTILSAFVVLSACVTSTTTPDTFYYVLNSQSGLQSKVEKSTAKQVKIQTVKLPDYMKQANLVLKLSDHQIKLANYHFWAEDLSQSITRAIVNDLNQQHQNISFTQQCSACDKLSITIDHFYPTEGGDVLLTGSYEMRINDKELTQARFSLKTELNEGGYDEAVAKMRQLVAELASVIEL